jgi:hypothetical protein
LDSAVHYVHGGMVGRITNLYYFQISCRVAQISSPVLFFEKNIHNQFVGIKKSVFLPTLKNRLLS